MTNDNKILARVVRDVSEDTYGRFVVQPLEKGFGTTIGNALRRVLLTTIPGAAITSIKIDGVLHEFATIPGVTEEVSEIILNLKQVRLKLHDSQPDKVQLQFKGKGEFKAAEIGKDNTQFEILNPDQHIFTMNEKADFNMELTIGSGTSWVPAEKNKTLDYPLGTIFIDSIFSPITQATYQVENLPGTTRGEELERLIISLKTDGSLNPEEALDYAAKLLQQYFGLFSKVQSTPIDVPQKDESEEIRRIRNLLKKSVDEMELSVRSYNCLKANDIKTIGELVSKEESEMLKFKNFGRKSLNELMSKLKEMGLEFGMDVDKYLSEEEKSS